MRRPGPPDHMRTPEDDYDPTLAELLRRAYARTVDVDTAARHLWAIDRAARLARRARRATRSRRAVVSALTSLMLVAMSGAAVAASGAALPGDALYAVKRGTERVHLVLAVRPAADAQVHLAIARRRWEEAQRAAGSRPAVVPRLLKETLVALDAAERGGGAVADEALALRSRVRGGSGQVAFGNRPPPTQHDVGHPPPQE
ncbi:MAG TPA: DUF5667 domain-containing protein, partial [Egibacteraceae bacterium]|nr:DUF5667 domain-containing protein [Egibacteraceae bacterium]